jgi:nitroreductase / dihydropteridine reductase
MLNMIKPSQIVDAMNWRYACKKFDNSKNVPESTVGAILDTLNLTATSLGMQLLKVVVVRDQQIKNKIVEFSYNQNQVAECSHLLILCRYTDVQEPHVDEYVNRSATTRGMDVYSEKIKGFRSMVSSTLSMPEEQKKHWMTNQVYIALGNLLNTCAILGIDACPMEGFEPKKIDAFLSLNELGLSSVLMCPIGYRHPEDPYSRMPKVRRDIQDFILEI